MPNNLVIDPTMNEYIHKYGVIRQCDKCVGPMVPSTIIYQSVYKDTILQLIDFPVMKCLNSECDNVHLGTGSLIKYIKKARKQYDLTGANDYYCNGSDQ